MILNFLKASYRKLSDILTKAGARLGSKIRALFGSGLNEATLEQLEKLFYEADLGVQTSQELTEKVRELHRANPQVTTDSLLASIREEIIGMLPKQSEHASQLAAKPSDGPLVMLIVGVNGNGKTTTIAKLAKRFKGQGQKVLIAAADTFRAAAIEQLELWANRLEIPLVKGNPKSDPAAVVFDAVTAGKARGVDTVLIDTAGRLHTKTALMHELEKIRRSCKKVAPAAPHETLLVLDATTGQNAIDQAKTFHQYTPITGLILTKLDGTAKGGIVISIQRQLGIPVKFIGIGEGAEDLEVFDPESFVAALFE